MADRTYYGFSLFRNDPDKKRSAKAPDYNGKGTIDPDTLAYITDELASGRVPELEISGWQKESQRGTRFISLSLKPPYKRQDAAPPPRNQGSSSTPNARTSNRQKDFDDDIPF